MAIACIVRVDPKVQVFATDKTEMVITALKMDGRTLMPASLMARTKGDAFELAPDAPSRRSSSEGRMVPRMKRLTM